MNDNIKQQPGDIPDMPLRVVTPTARRGRQRLVSTKLARQIRLPERTMVQMPEIPGVAGMIVQSVAKGNWGMALTVMKTPGLLNDQSAS